MTAKRLETWGKLAAGVAVSAALLWLALRHADFAQVVANLRRVEPRAVAISLALMLVAQVVRVIRWGILIRPFARLGIAAVSRVANLGIFLAVLMPLRLGELARPYLVKRECGAPLAAGLGAAAVERTLDGLFVTLGYFVAVTALPARTEIPAVLRGAAWGALALFATALTVIVLALLARPRLLRWLEILGRPFPRRWVDWGLAVVDGFVAGLKSLPDVKVVLLLLVSTATVWTVSGIAFSVIMAGFGWDLPVIAGFVVLSIVVFGIMIPAGPGFLGTYQAAIALGLAVFERDATEAAAFGVVAYFLSLGVVTCLGLPYLVTAGIESRGRGSVRDLVHDAFDGGENRRQDGAP